MVKEQETDVICSSLSDEEALRILQQDAQDLTDFRRYLEVMLELIPTHAIVFFDKAHKELGNRDRCALVNPQQYISGSDDDNYNTIIYALWALYGAWCHEKGTENEDGILNELAIINEIAKGYRKHNEEVMPEFTRVKREEIKQMYNTPAIELNDGIFSPTDFSKQFCSLCNKYGMFGFAIFGHQVDDTKVFGGYALTEPIVTPPDDEEPSYPRLEMLAGFCENTKLGMDLEKGFTWLQAMRERKD